MVKLLVARGYSGDVCLPAEYTDPARGGELAGDAVIGPLETDFTYIRDLFASAGDDLDSPTTDD